MFTDSTCECRRLVQFIFAGAVYYNALTNCATLLCRACVVADMCSRTLSDPANRLRKNTEEKILCRSPFRSGHISVICAGLGSKGKVGVQRGRETAGVPSFCPPTAVGRFGVFPRRGAHPLSRPQTANPPAAVRVPRSAGAEKKPPVRGEHANAVRVPRWVGAEKKPPVRGEHANAVRVPRSAGAEKKPPGGQCRKRCRFITIKN